MFQSDQITENSLVLPIFFPRTGECYRRPTNPNKAISMLIFLFFSLHLDQANIRLVIPLQQMWISLDSFGFRNATRLSCVSSLSLHLYNNSRSMPVIFFHFVHFFQIWLVTISSYFLFNLGDRKGGSYTWDSSRELSR